MKTKDKVIDKVLKAILDSGWGLIGKFDGEDFLVVDGWEPIERAVYLALEELVPKAIEKYYAPAGRVKKLHYIDGMGIESADLYIDGTVPAEVQEAFENTGFDDVFFSSIIGGRYWGFSDDYRLCDYCGSVVRNSPDSYSWRPNYIQIEGEIICRDCVNDDILQEYVESMSNNFKLAVFTRLIDDDTMERLGYEKVSGDHEAGIGEWCHDDPLVLYEEAQAARPGVYVFKIDDVGQFDVGFSLWRKVN